MSELSRYHLSEIEWVTNDLVKLHFDNYDHKFVAGEHVTLSTLDGYEAREYSIYSGQEQKGISLLIKIVKGGFFTPKLRNVKIGDLMLISRPHGAFSFNRNKQENTKHWFISTGTGIAPMNSMLSSYRVPNYAVVQGVRYLSDVVVSNAFQAEKLHLCVSREANKSEFKRVTDFLKLQHFTDEDQFYLCGNGNMVYDCKNLLRDMKVSPESIFTEVYF